MTARRARSPTATRRSRSPSAASRSTATCTCPRRAPASCVFAHGSGSSRHSPRNRFVAAVLLRRGARHAAVRPAHARRRSDDPQPTSSTSSCSADRLVGGDRLAARAGRTRPRLPVGYFGASTGGGAALVAAARTGPDVAAVVSRGGRPDLAGRAAGRRAGADAADRRRRRRRACSTSTGRPWRGCAARAGSSIVPGATHLFEEPGTLDEAARWPATGSCATCAGRPTPSARPERRPMTHPAHGAAARADVIGADPVAGPTRCPDAGRPRPAARAASATPASSARARPRTAPHEYYAWRADLSRRLIEEKGFSFIAVEGDWPDCYRVNRYVKGQADQDLDAAGVLARLRALADLDVGQRGGRGLPRLAARAATAPRPSASGSASTGWTCTACGTRCAPSSAGSRTHAPDAVPAARQALRCFEPYGEDAQEYAWSTRLVPELAARPRWSPCSPSCAGGPGDLDRDGEAPSTPSRTPWWCRTPSTTTARWCGAAGSPGTSATATWPRRSTGWCEHHGPGCEGHRLGAQHARRRRPLHRHGRGRAGQRRPAGPRAARRRRRWCWSASARTAAASLAASGWGEPEQVFDVPRPLRRQPRGPAAPRARRARRARVRRGQVGAVAVGPAGHRAIGVVYEPAPGGRATTSPP